MMYNEKIMNYFLNPQNCGLLHGANGLGEAQHPQFGDMVKVYVIIEDDIVVDIMYKAFGSACLIACAEVVANSVKGHSVSDVQNSSNQEIIDELKLPQGFVYASVLVKEAVENAINDYYEKLAKEEKKLQKKNKEQ